MACISKIIRDFSWDCASAQVNALNQVDEIVLINVEDIESHSPTPPSAASIVMKVGTKGYSIPSVNNGVKVTLAKKGGELYASLLDPVVTIVLPNDTFNSQETGAANQMANGEFVVAVKAGNEYYVLGLASPLSCTEIAGDSSTSPYVTVTLGVDEWQTGSTKFGLTKASYDALKILKA